MGNGEDRERLHGGFVSDVTRIGNVVIRTAPGNGAFVHSLFDLFETSGWPGAPRFLGFDDDGREILSFIEGTVPSNRRDHPWIVDDDALIAVAKLLRQCHDLSAGTQIVGVRRGSMSQ